MQCCNLMLAYDVISGAVWYSFELSGHSDNITLPTYLLT